MLPPTPLLAAPPALHPGPATDANYFPSLSLSPQLKNGETNLVSKEF